MKKLRGFVVFAAALAFTLLIVVLQLAWNLHSPEYLKNVAEKTNTNTAIAAALPGYAASKLPNPEATKVAFAQYATPAAIQESLEGLFVSITKAYTGKTDVVEVNLTPITSPITDSGYQIPPGTVFADDTLEVGGLAAVLRIAQRSILPSLLFLTVCVTLVMLIGVRRGIVPSLRSVLLVTIVLLAGLFVATLAIPMLVASLVSSSGLDPALRDIVLSFVDALITDSGRYYVIWMVLLGAAVVIMSISAGLVHRAHRPNKKRKKTVAPPSTQSGPKEL